MPVEARPLHEADVDPDPFVQFSRWYDDAVAHEILTAEKPELDMTEPKIEFFEVEKV